MDSANSRPNFTGLWKLDLDGSILRGPVPKQILMRIEHREPALDQQILLTHPDGKQQRLGFAYEIGDETTNSISGFAARSYPRWEGNEPVIESKMNTPQREFHFRDCWSLSEDGQTLAMRHRDDELAGQIAILGRASQAERTRLNEH